MRKYEALQVAGALTAAAGAVVAETTMLPVIAGIGIAAIGLGGERIEKKKADADRRAYERRMGKRIDFMVGAGDGSQKGTGTLRSGAYNASAGIPKLRCVDTFDEHGYLAESHIVRDTDCG